MSPEERGYLYPDLDLQALEAHVEWTASQRGHNSGRVQQLEAHLQPGRKMSICVSHGYTMTVAILIGWAFSGADVIEAGYMMLIITYAEFIRALAVQLSPAH